MQIVSHFVQALTHWGLNEMANILQTTFSNAYFWIFSQFHLPAVAGTFRQPHFPSSWWRRSQSERTPQSWPTAPRCHPGGPDATGCQPPAKHASSADSARQSSPGTTTQRGQTRSFEGQTQQWVITRSNGKWCFSKSILPVWILRERVSDHNSTCLGAITGTLSLNQVKATHLKMRHP